MIRLGSELMHADAQRRCELRRSAPARGRGAAPRAAAALPCWCLACRPQRVRCAASSGSSARCRQTEVAPARNADGIVVLTGGALRISDALDLLAAGRGQRLLITRVNPATRAAEISRLMPEHRRCSTAASISIIPRSTPSAMRSRPDAGRRARGFQSLIVVTSNFHMPRAMAELDHQLPGVALVPSRWCPTRCGSRRGGTSAATARLLFSEYLKYIVARVAHAVCPSRSALSRRTIASGRCQRGHRPVLRCSMCCSI